MHLDAYIRERGLTDDGFAMELGPDVSGWAVRKWRYGQRIPRPAMQQRIEKATSSLVTPNDFVAAAVAADRRREAAVAKRAEAIPSTQTTGAAA